MRTALCIGGPLDGQMVDIKGTVIVVPFVHRRPLRAWPLNPTMADLEPTNVQRFEYKIEQFTTPTEKYYFAIGIDDGPDLAMRVLIETYAASKKK